MVDNNSVFAHCCVRPVLFTLQQINLKICPCDGLPSFPRVVCSVLFNVLNSIFGWAHAAKASYTGPGSCEHTFKHLYTTV